jgi:hypothetical protein
MYIHHINILLINIDEMVRFVSYALSWKYAM